MKFNQHRETLLNRHVSLKLRLKFFDSIISPAILFGLTTVVKSDGKMLPVAHFNDNGSVQWLDKSVVSEGVREALGSFIAELE